LIQDFLDFLGLKKNFLQRLFISNFFILIVLPTMTVLFQLLFPRNWRKSTFSNNFFDYSLGHHSVSQS
jgi:hypothetical protein